MVLISSNVSFLVSTDKSCSSLSMAESSLKMMRKINRKPMRMTALMLPLIPMMLATVVERSGKMAMAAIPPQTITRARSFSQD